MKRTAGTVLVTIGALFFLLLGASFLALLIGGAGVGLLLSARQQASSPPAREGKSSQQTPVSQGAPQDVADVSVRLQERVIELAEENHLLKRQLSELGRPLVEELGSDALIAEQPELPLHQGRPPAKRATDELARLLGPS